MARVLSFERGQLTRSRRVGATSLGEERRLTWPDVFTHSRAHPFGWLKGPRVQWRSVEKNERSIERSGNWPAASRKSY